MGSAEEERRQRLTIYSRIASLSGFAWPVCQGDELKYLEGLLESCKVAGNKLKDTAASLEVFGK